MSLAVVRAIRNPVAEVGAKQREHSLRSRKRRKQAALATKGPESRCALRSLYTTVDMTKCYETRRGSAATLELCGLGKTDAGVLLMFAWRLGRRRKRRRRLVLIPAVFQVPQGAAARRAETSDRRRLSNPGIKKSPDCTTDARDSSTSKATKDKSQQSTKFLRTAHCAHYTHTYTRTGLVTDYFEKNRRKRVVCGWGISLICYSLGARPAACPKRTKTQNAPKSYPKKPKANKN